MKKTFSLNSPRTVAYLRVSTLDQDLEKNTADILKSANSLKLGRAYWIKKNEEETYLEKEKDCGNSGK